MGYFYTILSALCGTGKGAVSKNLSGDIKTLGDNLLVNGIRMLYCTMIGFIALLITGQVSGLRLGLGGILISLGSAVSFAAFVVLWMVCVHSCAMVTIDVSLMISVLIPTLAGIVFWNEIPGIGEWVGFSLLIVSVIILGSYSSQVRGKLTKSSLALLILVGAANGFCSLTQKWFTMSCEDSSTFVFNFYTYLFAIPIFGIMLLFASRTEKINFKLMATPKMYGGVFIVAVLLYLNLMFRMFAVELMDAALLYTLSQGLGIINSAVVAALFFHEPITRRSIVGIGVAVVAVIALNF